MRIVFAISRATSVEPHHTTLKLALTALERGHQVRLVEPWDFEVDGRSRLIARSHAFDEPTSQEDMLLSLRQRAATRRYVEMTRVDVILIRVNPLAPEILVFAEMARRAGVTVHNDPSTILLTSHKSYLANLDGVPRPRTLVTRSRATALLFASELDMGVVFKPARSSGGRGVDLVRQSKNRRRLEEAFDLAHLHGDGYVVVQEYLPEAAAGEKRLMWLDGELIGGYLRSRSPSDFRHNLAQGGSPQPCPIDPEDHALARAVTPRLRHDGVWLAGLDVIGGRIVEVNTLNPGGVYYGDFLNGTCMAERIIERLEADHQEPR